MSWLDDQKKKAELEAHRERVRQVMSRLRDVKSATWVGNLMYVEAAKTVGDLQHACKMMDIIWKEEGDLVTKDETIEKLKAEINKLNSQVEKLQYGRWGKEPANGSVFKIERRFEQFGKGYTYAVVRADGKWYITGTRGDAVKAMDWEQLKRWAGKYSRVWAMTAREELVD